MCPTAISVHSSAVTRALPRLFLGLALAALAVQLYRTFLQLAAFRTFALTVVSLCLEALPFLVLGAVAATAVRRYLPAGALARIARRAGPVGIPVAALGGLVAPVCECAIVPTVAGLRERGLPLPYAITVLVSVPLINPVVVASTLAAFPGRPDLVLARFAGGFAVAVGTGLVFTVATRRQAPPAVSGHRVEVAPIDPASARRGLVALATGTVDEFLEISRYFVVGAVLSALVQVLVPTGAFAAVGSSVLAAGAAAIVFAFVLSVCSEADAFVGKAFLPLLPAPAIVAFLVFGPMLDLKNAAMLHRVVTPRQLALLAITLTVLVLALTMILGGLWN